MKSIRNFVIIISSVLGTFLGMHIGSCVKSPKSIKSDTTNVWIRYFVRLGGINSKDTTNMSVKVHTDTGIVYYVPYDTVYKFKDSTNLRHIKDTSRKLKVMISLPKSWLIYEYGKMPLK